MNKMQRQVLEFHEVMDHAINTAPTLYEPKRKLRADLIAEECVETVAALTGHRVRLIIEAGEQSKEFVKEEPSPDIVAAIDGFCDIMYVVLGAAITMGVDLEPVFDIVHAANMAKAGGPIRPDGKRLKPEGWKPPAVAEELKRQWLAKNLSPVPVDKCLTCGGDASDRRLVHYAGTYARPCASMFHFEDVDPPSAP